MNKKIRIQGMNCNHCVMSVQKQLSKFNLIQFKVDIGLAEIEFDGNKVKVKEINDAIENAGFIVLK